MKKDNDICWQANHTYSSIDFMRAIASFSVVIIHFGFPGNIGIMIHSVMMYAVPFFYLVSGFFVYHSDKMEFEYRIIKSLKRTVKIFTIAALIYFFLYMAYVLIEYKSFDILFLSLKEENILKFILLNDWPLEIGGPIWYLHALLYAYIILYYMNKFNCMKFKIPVIIILLLINAIFSEFSAVFSINEYFPFENLGGNFFTRGIPFLLMGSLAKENIEKIRNMKLFICICMLFSGVILPIIELWILWITDTLVYQGYFQGNMLLALSIFFLCIKNPCLRGQYLKIANIGYKYSLSIYLLHQPVGFIFVRVVRMIGILKPLRMQSVYIFGVSLLLKVIYDQIVKQIKDKQLKVRRRGNRQN